MKIVKAFTVYVFEDNSLGIAAIAPPPEVDENGSVSADCVDFVVDAPSAELKELFEVGNDAKN